MSRFAIPLPASSRVPPAGGKSTCRLHRVARAGAALAVLALGSPAFGQTPPLSSPSGLVSTGILAGIVEDSLGVPVAGARASLVGLGGSGTSENDGTFRFGGVSPGAHTLVVRRIGFRPESVTVDIAAGVVKDVRVRLRPNAQWVAPVLIDARSAKYTGTLRGFYERRDRGMGVYFTAENIEARNPRVVTDLLRTIPGTRVVSRGGEQVVTFRDMRCLPLVWVDGAAASTAYLDPDVIEPGSLAGIEVYKGAGTVPGALTTASGGEACGVIALWTKRGEEKPKLPAKPVTAEDLSNLIASMSLYTAENVEIPAAIEPSRPLVPVYPNALLSEGIPGRVVVEFVVDTTGRVDMNTFGTVTTTHALFTEAVRRAVAIARFTPARLHGRLVRQLVQLPFSFTVPRESP